MKEGAAEREDQPGEAAASFPATVAGPSHGVEPGLVEIAVGLPVRGTFTYRLTEKTGPLSAGCRVLVPFGRRRVTGYLLGAASCEPPEAETKEVLAPLDAVPLLARDVLSLCRFAAGYYLYPLGEAMRTALPPGINVSSERRARLTETGRAALASGEDASSGVGVDVRARAS